jgi:hypothetical protein
LRAEDAHHSEIESSGGIEQLGPKRNKICSKQPAAVCMSPPNNSSSNDIDLFRVRQAPPELPDRYLPPAANVVPRYRPKRYHSMQLALVTGLFACGGLICSIFLVDGSDHFLQLRYWPRKSYSSPVLATPQRPVTAPAIPQSGPSRSNGADKNAASQKRRVGARNPQATSPLSLASAANNSSQRR